MLNCVLEQVSPERAAELLDLNTDNYRSVRQERVDRYAKEMVLGNWELNGETIKISGTRLVDGQHRLLAVIKSQRVIPMLVVTGVNSGDKTIDRGLARTVAQWCKKRGFKYPSDVASVARACLGHEKGLWGGMQFHAKDFLDSEVYDFIERNGERLQQSVCLIYPAGSLLARSVSGAIAFIGASANDPNDCPLTTWFFSVLKSGEGITSTEPVYHLRNRLITQPAMRKLTSHAKRFLATIAWNMTVAGETCGKSGLLLRLSGPGAIKPPNEIQKAKPSYLPTSDEWC